MARAALINGSERASYLKLALTEEEAIVEVAIQAEHVALDEHCSGVLIAPGLVLSAKHCAHELENPSTRVIFSLGEQGDQLELGASISAVHPDLDLMLVSLDETPDELAAVTALAPLAALPAGFGPGSLLQTAGVGSDGNGGRGKRAFLVETLQELTDSDLVVDASSLGGACFGDSGGPLLVRDDDGFVRTFGILASGSNSCFGQDRYTRVDGLVADWIYDTAGLERDSPVFEGAGEPLGEAGRCFDGRAIWHEAGRLHAELCSLDGPCGFSEHAQGFRCLSSDERDPCRGVSDVGSCVGGAAVQCVDGKLATNPCSACDFACARSPKTGGPVCLGTSG